MHLSTQMALVTCLRACPLAEDATKQVWQHGCLPLFVGFIPSHSGAMWLLLTYLLFLFHIFLIFINFGNEIGQLLGMGKVSFEFSKHCFLCGHPTSIGNLQELAIAVLSIDGGDHGTFG